MGDGIRTRLDNAFIDAQKAKDALRVSVLRMIRADIKNKEIEKKQVKLTEDEIIQVINTSIKKRKESIGMFKKGGREDLVEKETKEISILMGFLPEQLSESKVREIVKSSIKTVAAINAKDMGNVIKEVMKETRGRADGKLISQLVKDELEKL